MPVPEPEPLPWELRLGAQPLGDDSTRFRVWAPRAGSLVLRVRGTDHELRDEGHGVLVADVPAAHGDDYVYVVDGRELPDP